MTLRQLYEEGRDYLLKHGVPEAELSARLLLCEAFSMSAGEYLFSCERELSELYDKSSLSGLLEDYSTYLALRGRRVPIQQILGRTQFMGLDFAVSPDVLIPRQDTETLVEQVLYDYPRQDIRVLDMCTGSGCIAASLAVLGGYRQVVGADISMEALEIAQGNALRLLREAERREDEYRQEIRFARTDLFRGITGVMEELGIDSFDVIVSNPPYIRTADIEELEPEVRDFEPRLALDGSYDGLHFYRRIAAEAGPYLQAGGSLYLEIGADEAEDVKKILEAAGFEEIRVIRDLADKDRVIGARKPCTED